VSPASMVGVMSNRLTREAFKTSRQLEFTNRKELVTHIGHDVAQWPQVLFKELIENAIDAAEEADLDPIVHIVVRGDILTFTSNGIFDPDTVPDLADFSVRVSSREAYVSPSRGQQGTALQTIFALLCNLDGEGGRSETSHTRSKVDNFLSSDPGDFLG
jgi:DNA topoisomerase VI subunit B